MLGLLVQRTTRRDVAGYIGDGDYQPPAILSALGIDRIVEITCVGAIDGDQGQLT